jgi:single-stranded DNA-binding protein
MQKVIYTNVRLTDDAKQRTCENGSVELSFSIAAQRENVIEGKQDVDFIPIKTYVKSDKQKEYFIKRLAKGATVEFTGRLNIDRFKETNGHGKTATYVVAHRNSLVITKVPYAKNSVESVES